MKKIKTNRDRLNLLSDEELAVLLIGTKIIDEGDWWFDGEDETYHEDYREYYTSPATDELFDYFDQALKETVRWLRSDYDRTCWKDLLES